MSVTFGLAGDSGFVDCPKGCPRLPHGAYEGEVEASCCGECFGLGYVSNPLSLNLANTNARDLLAFLGLPSEEYGEIRSRELQRRIEICSLERDEGRPTVVDEGLILCGRSPRRMQEYLSTLLDICEEAGDLGMITWG